LLFDVLLYMIVPHTWIC